MKSLSDNLLTLMLIFALGLSPLQNIFASVSGCMNMAAGNMNHGMHHQMKNSDHAQQTEMKQSGNKTDCCNKNECGTTHCASSAISAVIISHDISDIRYTVSTLYSKPSVSLVQFYPSTLYRPPKI